MRSLLVLASSTCVLADVPSSQQADETTLLQGLVRTRRHAQDVQQTTLKTDPVRSPEPGWWKTHAVRHIDYTGLGPASFPDADFPEYENPPLPPFEADLNNFPDGLPGRLWTTSSAGNPKMQDEISRVLLPKEIYGDIGGKCMDGGEAGYYYGAPANGASDLWIIHLQGGGACFEMEGPSACDREADKIPDKFDRASRGPPNDMLSAKETKNRSPFREAHHMYLPYCTEDFWSGQTVTPTNFTAGQFCQGDEPCVDQWGFYFSGHLIFKNILHHILSNEPAARDMKQVLLTGSSAGGVGVLQNCDFLQTFLNDLRGDIFDHEVEVKCSPQAGMFFPGYTDDHPDDVLAPTSNFEAFSAGQASEPSGDRLWHDIMLHRHFFPHSCREAKQGQNWRCLTMVNVYPTVSAPLLMMQNKMDYLLGPGMGSPFDTGVDTCAKKAYISYIGRAMENTVANINMKASDGWFLASCADHGNGIKPSLTSTIVNGRNSLEVSLEWFEGGSPRVFDGCADEDADGFASWGGPCNGGCSADLTVADAVEGDLCCGAELTRLCSDTPSCDCAKNHVIQLEAMGCTRETVKDLCE